MKRVSSGTAAGNRGEERGVSTRERKKRYGQDRRAEIRGTLLHTHTYMHIYIHRNIRTHTVRFFIHTDRQEEAKKRRSRAARIMEKRRDRSSKARRGSERRHWSRYFYDSNAQKPDSAQRIPRPFDARSATSTIIGDVSRHRSFP